MQGGVSFLPNRKNPPALFLAQAGFLIGKSCEWEKIFLDQSPSYAFW
jgi:hypothetical protein